MTADQSLLEAALVGYAWQRDEIDARIAEIRTELKAGGKVRTMSFAGRKRVAAAQRKRWAAQRETVAPRKRKLSAAGRKRIAEATKKRWAEYRARKAGANS